MFHITDIFKNFLNNEKRHSEHKGQISFDCPRCSDEKNMPEGDRKGKLEINYIKGFFNCWVCGESHGTKGVIEKLIKYYGSKQDLSNYNLVKNDYLDDKFIKNESRKQHNLKLPKEFIPLTKGVGEYNYSTVIKYLKKRNISKDIIEEYNIGYCNEGYYKNRIIIPSYDVNGNLDYFTGRTFNKYFKLKYLNPDVDKEYIIFNESKLNYDSDITLVEGVFDHIVIPNSIPLLGKSLSNIIKNNLLKKANAKIYIMLDDDALENAILIHNELNVDNLSGKVFICNPPQGYDVSLIYEKLGYEGISKLMKKKYKV